MFNYASQEKFDILKKRWEQELAAGCPDIDPRMVDTLKVFNTLPGVVSIWSCSGHTKEEQEAKNKTFAERQRRHVLFAARPGSEELFVAFSHWCATQDNEDWSLARPELSTFDLVWCFKTLPNGEVAMGDIGGLYPAWKLSMSYFEREDLPAYMTEQWDSLVRFITDYCKGFQNA